MPASASNQSRRMYAGLVSAVLRARLDKAQQCSAWHLRPLTAAQLAYAANDAAVLLALLDALTGAAARAGLLGSTDSHSCAEDEIARRTEADAMPDDASNATGTCNSDRQPSGNPMSSSARTDSSRVAAPGLAAQAGRQGAASMQTHFTSGPPGIVGVATPYAKKGRSWRRGRVPRAVPPHVADGASCSQGGSRAAEAAINACGSDAAQDGSDADSATSSARSAAGTTGEGAHDVDATPGPNANAATDTDASSRSIGRPTIDSLDAALRGSHISGTGMHARERSASGVLVSSHPITDLSQEVLSDADTCCDGQDGPDAPVSHLDGAQADPERVVPRMNRSDQRSSGVHRCPYSAQEVREAWASTLVFESGRFTRDGGLAQGRQVRCHPMRCIEAPMTCDAAAICSSQRGNKWHITNHIRTLPRRQVCTAIAAWTDEHALLCLLAHPVRAP